MPVERTLLAPLAALGKFLPHKKQLLTGMRVLVGVEQSQRSKLLPHVARHFVQQRILAMDDFIVRIRQNKVFGEGIEKRKGELVVLIFAMNGILREVVKGI